MDTKTTRENFLKDLATLLEKYKAKLEIEVDGGGYGDRDKAELGLSFNGEDYTYLLDTNHDYDTVLSASDLRTLANES